MGSIALAIQLLAAPAAAEPPPPDVDEVLQAIVATSVVPVDPADLQRAAVEGMLHLLDGLTGGGNALLSEERWRQWEASREGRYHGIGFQFVVVPRQGLLVTRVYDGSPADRAGLSEGMAIVGVGATSFGGMNAAQMHRALLTSEEDPVRLVLLDGEKRRRVVTVGRGPYRIDPVTRVDPGPPTVIRIDAFSRGAAAELAEELRRAPAGQLVLDLRDNRGGMLEEAVASADLFLPAGTRIGETWRRDGSGQALAASKPATWTGVPVLLVNGGTAGEAELFAAALHVQLGAPLVGSTTAGAGCAAEAIALASGYHLLLATALYLDPNGHPLQGHGLDPDPRVDGPLPAMVAPHTPPPDLQLEAALRLASTTPPR